MMSLAEQLKRLAVPAASSYAIEAVRRKSLVYEDPSKVDTLLCYQESCKAFEQLAKRDDIFTQFRKTLFAETSCRLEMCTLFPNEKTQLDSQVARFLCYLSPYLKHFDALHSMEWLVHKFQIHHYYVEDYVRCIMPYHETGLFAKFLQLVDFQTCASEFRWLKPYAESGRCLSRSQLVRECTRQRPLVPFLCSMILNAVKLCEGLSANRLNDMTNFFLTTITALCDSGISDAKLANLVDAFQHVIRTGLMAMDCSSFQSASMLVILRISLKLNLNHDLVFGWIDCLLKRTRPGNAWETLRVINKLMRAQHIAVLPAHLSEKHSALLTILNPVERKMIEDEEASLLNQVDANMLAAEAMHDASSGVRSKTLTMDIDASRSEVPVRVRSSKRTVDESDLLSDCQSEVQVVHALLASLPDHGGGCCLFKDSGGTCTCPKLDQVQCDQNWLCNLIMFIVPEPRLFVPDAIKVPKRGICRARHILNFVRMSMEAHLTACNRPPSPPHTRSPVTQRPCTSSALFSKPERLLESGLDHALPLLFGCLLHPASSIRIDVYSLLTFWLSGLARRKWHSSLAPHVSKALSLLGVTEPNKADEVLRLTLTEEVCELLRGDPLSMLSKSAPTLTRLAVNLLFSEPLSRIPSALACWTAGLQLLSEDTIHELFSIRSTDSVSLVGWSGFIHLLRTTDESYATLQSSCLLHLNSGLFEAISSVTTSTALTGKAFVGQSQSQPVAPVESVQTELLDAICDLGSTDSAKIPLLETLLSRLKLKVDHFDYLLLKLDTARCVRPSSDKKSLFARVAETREARRRHAKECELNGTEINSMDTDLSSFTSDNCVLLDSHRLRLLGIITTILSEAVPRLKELSVSASEAHSESIINVLTQMTPDSRLKLKSAPSSVNLASSLSPILHLLTPLVNHLISLLSQEQRFPKPWKSAPEVACSSDSDSDEESSNHLPKASSDLSSLLDPNQPLPTTVNAADSESMGNLDSPCVRTLVRHCVYRILVCIIAILSEGNRVIQTHGRKQRLRFSAASNTRCISSALLAAQSVVGPVFQCLTVYPAWTALHQQVLLCFIELAAMFPVALCPRLIGMIQWVASNEQVMRLDNVHSLALLGRLVVIAVPALVRASTSQTKAALQVVVLFVDGLPGLASRLPRRRLAFYAGLVRGLAQVTGPLALESLSSSPPRSSSKVDKNDRKVERQQQRALLERCKESWIGSWLWALSLVFLSRDWKDEAVADQVVPLLIDLHNQFPWDKQVSAWYECLGFLHWLTKNSEQLSGANQCPLRFKRHFIPETPTRKVQVVDTEIAPPPKRQRTNSSGGPSEITPSIPPEDIWSSKLMSVHVAEALISSVFQSKDVEELTPVNSSIPALNASTVWSLTGRAVQLLATLLADPTYEKNLEVASDDPLGLGAVYGRLVQQVVHLMIAAAATMTRLKPTEESLSDCTVLLEGAKQSVAGLQTVLMQIHDSVSGHIFIRMVSDLFDSMHRGLRRKALDLLAAKLTSLTATCQPILILDDPAVRPSNESVSIKKKSKKHRHLRAPLDLTFEAGLVQLTAQLASQYTQLEVTQLKVKDTSLFGSSFHRQCLSCLRDLAKLLAHRYPGEFMRTLDILIATPQSWWPIQAESTDTSNVVEPRGSGAAESRSLTCLFFVECLQRLPSQSLCPNASATTHRLSVLLHFALDHCLTSCRLSQRPTLTLNDLEASSGDSNPVPHLVTGLVHSRDQHLLAGLTLLANLLELAIVHRRTRSKTVSSFGSDSVSFSCGDWLQFHSGSKSRQTGHTIPVSDQLLTLIFKLGQSDLASITGANPERSGSTLKQITTLVSHIRHLLLYVTDLSNVLPILKRVMASAVTTSDTAVLHGCFSYLGDLTETAKHSTDTNMIEPAKIQLIEELTQLCATQPELLRDTVTFALRAAARRSCVIEPSLYSELYRALAALLSAVPSETRLGLCSLLIEWVTNVSKKHSKDEAFVNKTLNRLSIFYHVIADLSARIPAEEFCELSKQITLVDYLVLTFHILSGQNRKSFRKLGEKLNLKLCVGRLSRGVNAEALEAALSAVECLRRWLIVEVENTNSLDVGSGGGSVLELPSAFISLLDVTRIDDAEEVVRPPAITDSQLMQALDSLIDSIAGDEALLRPLGSALAHRITQGAHWSSRLFAIRLLKRTFDRLSSPDQAGMSTAHCLVSDALTALSEALEDDRPEVETAANKLFAELEQSGLTTRNETA